MTDVDLYNSLTQSLTSNISSFISGEKNKNDFNKQMIIQVSLLLDIQNNLINKNKEIKKLQDIEIEKILKEEEKTKKKRLIKKKNDESSDEEIEDEDNPLTKLINPTLQSYIPLSQISFSIENKLLNIDENCLFIKKDFNEENEKEEGNNILKFEQSAILPMKNILYNKKEEYESYINLLKKEEILENNINKEEKGYFDLISINQTLFENKNEDIVFDDNILYEIPRTLTTSIGGIINNNSNYMSLNDSLRPTNDSPLKKKYRTDSFDNEYEQFKNNLNKNAFKKHSKNMSILYLRKMLEIYIKIKKTSENTLFCEDKMFLNLTKIFLLKKGISEKKIYEDTLRNLVYKGHKCDFDNYLTCFLKILKLSDDNTIIKYKFLLYLLLDEDSEEINYNQLSQYFSEMLKNKLIYDEDICNDIIENLINKYNELYKGNNNVFHIRNLCFALESFFEHK